MDISAESCVTLIETRGDSEHTQEYGSAATSWP